jgi:hypothetical protein
MENLKSRRGRRFRARLLRVLTALAVVYVMVYLFLSLGGGYVTHTSGNHRMSYGLAIPDSMSWQPYWGTGGTFVRADGSSTWDCDWIGFLFAPLLYVDQRSVHPTIPILKDDLTIDAAAIPPQNKLHHRERAGQR